MFHVWHIAQIQQQKFTSVSRYTAQDALDKILDAEDSDEGSVVDVIIRGQQSDEESGDEEIINSGHLTRGQLTAQTEIATDQADQMPNNECPQCTIQTISFSFNVLTLSSLHVTMDNYFTSFRLLDVL